jgi:glycerol kinase
MAADSGVTLDVLKVDGGVTANDLCMQLQADILGVPVSRPVVAEPTWSEDRRAVGYAGWKKAINRTLDWVDVG